MATQVLIHPSDTVLIQDLHVFHRFYTRLKGLMFTQHLPQGHGVKISPCQQIHTQFMRYPIDVVFVSADHVVIHVEHAMKPWRFSRFYKQSHYVLELNAGEAAQLRAGDMLFYKENKNT